MRKIGFIVLLTAFALSTFAAPARGVRRPIMQAVHEVGRPNPIPRVVVILVSYSDLAIQSKDSAQAIDSLFNITGYAFNGATGSVRDYFIAQSDSAYQPIFDVFGPVTLSNNRAYYGAGNPDKRPGDMIKEACTLVDDQVNFADYDSDGDGKVDCVYVLYAGIGANDVDGVADAIWPHQSTVYGLTLDSKQISTYACSGEIDGYLKNRTCIGPICHEFGHAIGMPDYYNGDDYVFGEWSIMTYGMYNNDANTPPDYSLFDKEYMGWTTVPELPVDSQADITLTTAYGDGYKMQVGATTYYIENRQKTGWDRPLPGHGMLVWQVKYDQSKWNSNKVNGTSGSPRYTVFSASGGLMKHDHEHGGFWSTAADPFPGSQNVTSWTAGEGFVLTDIAETNGVISFKLNGGAPIDPTGVETVTGDGLQVTGRKIMRNGQLIILRGEKAYNALGIEIQ